MPCFVWSGHILAEIVLYEVYLRLEIVEFLLGLLEEGFHKEWAILFFEGKAPYGLGQSMCKVEELLLRLSSPLNQTANVFLKFY